VSELRKILLASLDVIPDATGASTRLTEILRGLTPVFNVDALTPKTEAHSHIERYYGARLMRVPMLRRDLPSRAQTFERAVRRQLESEEYDLIHVTDAFAGYPVCQRKGQAGYRIIYDAYSLPSLHVQLTNPEVSSELRFMTRLRRIELHCLLAADLVLVSSEAFKSQIERLGVPADQIRVVPPPVDIARFVEAPLPPEPPLKLLYIGACRAWEGIETVLKALRLLLDLGVQAKLAIGGELDEPAKRLLRAASASLRLGDAVERLGPIAHEQMHEVLEQAHICLAPFCAPAAVGAVGLGSLKLVEYLAAGRPVVAADSPLHRELAGTPPAAVFFRPGDAGELAGKLQQLAKDPAQRAQLAERARSRARSNFDAGLARKAVLRAYYDLLDPTVVVTADAYVVPDRAGGHEGDAPTSTQSGLADTGEPDTNPAASESTTSVGPLPPPVPESTPTAVPLPTELTPPAGVTNPSFSADTTQFPEEPDWFSAHLPADPSPPSK
jgi:glycosyltransferase involved in cell wall biosynthesis